MFCRYKNVENFQIYEKLFYYLFFKKEITFKWIYQLETWSDITLECDITFNYIETLT